MRRESVVGAILWTFFAACASSGRQPANADSGEMAYEYGPGGEVEAGRGEPSTAEGDEEAPRRYRPASGTSYGDTENLSPRVRRRYAGERRVNADNFFDSAPNEGSLWVLDGQDNYYFTKNRNRAIGDLVTVVLEDQTVREALAEIKRTLSSPERKMELAFAQEKIKAKTLGDPEPAIVPVPGSSFVSKEAKKDEREPAAVAPSPSPAPAPATALTAEAAAAKQKEIEQARREKLAKMAKATLADVDIVPYVGLKNADLMTAEIVERYPNGNFKVRGTKKVAYRSGYRLVTLLGVVRGSDINESNDTILSGKLYEYRLTVLR